MSGVAAGCAGPQPGFEIGPDADFERGKELVERGRPLDAIPILESFRIGHPGSDRVDDATYWLGRARARLGEHILAVQEYDRLLADYPQSELRETTEFARAQAFFDAAYSPARDPEPTMQAIEAFESYLRHYPSGVHAADASRLLREGKDRLAVKAYLNGRTYQQLGHERAAIIYFEKSLAILPDSSRAAESMLELARCHSELGEPEQARAAYQRLLDALGASESVPPESKRGRRLRELRETAEVEMARLDSVESALD